MIAILSDFGNSEYLGVMKGAILSINENSKIIDLYNNISHQNIKEGAWILFNNYKYFPKKTVFLCVVDPGVGSKRQCLAIKTKNYFFVGPDNGLMYAAAMKDKIQSTVKLPTNNASKTFHGRDIFAKAAAQIEKGIDINKLGQSASIKTKIGFHLKGREGEISRIDNFGNIVTNLTSLGKTIYNVKSNNLNQKMKFYPAYGSAPFNVLFLIKGSCNTLEISMKNSKAANKLILRVGDKIEIH